jgi:hypothetical protein
VLTLSLMDFLALIIIIFVKNYISVAHVSLPAGQENLGASKPAQTGAMGHSGGSGSAQGRLDNFLISTTEPTKGGQFSGKAWKVRD